MIHLATFRFATDDLIKGRVIYRPEEYSFDFEPLKAGGGQSITVNDLQLEFDLETHQVFYAYGYCPYISWILKKISLPPSQRGKVFVNLVGESEVFPGGAYRLTKPAELPVYVDTESGWVCIGQPKFDKEYAAVEFATNTIAVVEGDQLKSIWLHPEELPKEVLNKAKYRRKTRHFFKF